MLPQTNLSDVQINQMPTKTYRLNFFTKQISNMTDELEAMQQAVYLILNTERYQYLIYDWNYGVELANLIGREKSYALPEIERRITDALTQDERILRIENFSFATERQKTTAYFTVKTIFGDFEMTRTVNF